MKITHSNSIFFLGGHDLEMLEIKKILLKNNFEVHDKNLSWGAKLSNYKDLFSTEKLNICIELEEDTKPPQKYLRIDHHNQYSHLDSSLEQIAKLLYMTLSEAQKLIATDDKLGLFGFDKVEDAQIIFDEKIKLWSNSEDAEEAKRLFDSAKKASVNEIICINNQKKLKDFLFTDPYFIDNFSTANRVNIKHIIIYNNEELSYYGKKKDLLLERLDAQYRNKEIFTGGQSSDGYIGTTKEYKGQIAPNLLNTIKKIVANDFYSEHIFQFAFNWNINQKDSFSDRTRLVSSKNEEKILEGLEINSNFWQEQSFEIQTHSDYNSLSYRNKIIKKDDTKSSDKDKIFDRYFIYKNSNLEYEIKLNDKSFTHSESIEKTTIAKLPINKIDLTLYDSGVGILRFFMTNYDYKDIESIKYINNFGRRLRPIFLSANFSLVDVQDINLPKSIKIRGIAKSEEDFIHYTDVIKLKTDPHKIPNFIDVLLNTKNGLTNAHLDYFGDSMFVNCWISPKIEASIVAKINKKENKIDKKDIFCKAKTDYDFLYAFENNTKPDTDDKFIIMIWNQLIMVDSGADMSSNSSRWMAEDNKKFTYTRWAGDDDGVDSTLYGINSRAFICLTTMDDDFIRQSNIGLYANLVKQVLSERMAFLRFRSEVEEISLKVYSNTETTQQEYLIKNTEELITNFLEFKNKGKFEPAEFSTQIQGIEIHERLSNAFGIASTTSNLDALLNQLYNISTFLYQKNIEANQKKTKEENDARIVKQNKYTQNLAEALAVLGGLFAIPSFIVSYFGYSFFDFGKSSVLDSFWYKFFVVLLIVALCIFYFRYFVNKLKNESENEVPKNNFKLIGMIAILVVMIFPPIFLKSCESKVVPVAKKNDSTKTDTIKVQVIVAPKADSISKPNNGKKDKP